MLCPYLSSPPLSVAKGVKAYVMIGTLINRFILIFLILALSYSPHFQNSNSSVFEGYGSWGTCRHYDDNIFSILLQTT